MATNKSVSVLVPNGRRQNVKVTPDTTILQVLEEICRKHGFNADDYDLKHFNKVLDPNTIFRFSGLSNNAQLEMVTCTKVRSTSNITIGIQLESGERLMGQFASNISLAEILIKTCPNTDLERAALIYMHREVYGREALEETTLKSLGLNNGKAMLRLIHRHPEQLKTQAHIYTPLVPKPSKPNDTSYEISKKKSLPVSHSNKITDPIALLKMEKENVKDIYNPKCIKEMDVEIKLEVKEQQSKGSCTDDVEVSHKNDDDDDKIKSLDFSDSHTVAKENDKLEIEFLGERNALVFNQAEAQALPRDELPDSFFDLTMEDAKALLRDAKRRREELEDAPLLTDAQRRLEENKRTLNQLHKYRQTIIRIQFPDQFVLQGLFGPLETVETVKDFIKNYLEDPTKDFTVYTSPPKYILNPDVRLIEENLVPSAIIYYSGTSTLKSNVKAKITDPETAGTQAIKSRISLVRQDEASNNDIHENPVPGPSSGRGLLNQSQNKIPKWFKPLSK